MKHFIVLSFLIFIYQSVNSKEWDDLKEYQIETGERTLKPQDWFKKDRKQNSLVWQNANLYNLSHNLPGQYETIKQRRDFYEWYIAELNKKGHEVLWPNMSYFISRKLALIKSFPFSIFTSKDLKEYAYLGSEAVFDASFKYLNDLMLSLGILTEKEALEWDENILHKEQFEWLLPIYELIDEKTLKTIDRMAKGKGFYSLLVPKDIRFEGDISKEQVRYDYGLNSLRPYFAERKQ